TGVVAAGVVAAVAVARLTRVTGLIRVARPGGVAGLLRVPGLAVVTGVVSAVGVAGLRVVLARVAAAGREAGVVAGVVVTRVRLVVPGPARAAAAAGVLAAGEAGTGQAPPRVVRAGFCAVPRADAGVPGIGIAGAQVARVVPAAGAAGPGNRGWPRLRRQAGQRPGGHLRQRARRGGAVVARPRLVPARQVPRGAGALPGRARFLPPPVVPPPRGGERTSCRAGRARGAGPGRRIGVTGRVRRARRLLVVPGTPWSVPVQPVVVIPAAARHPPAPGADATGSPAGRPVERSASSAPCRISAAAALSTCPRRSRDPRPPRRSASWASTVVNRSSTSRTGTGASRAARDSANALACPAAAPARPD